MRVRANEMCITTEGSIMGLLPSSALAGRDDTISSAGVEAVEGSGTLKAGVIGVCVCMCSVQFTWGSLWDCCPAAC